MKSQKIQSETAICATLWDEFVAHLESIYFDSAAELLDAELLSFEYSQYISGFAEC